MPFAVRIICDLGSFLFSITCAGFSPLFVSYRTLSPTLLALEAPWNVCQNIVFVSLFFSEVLSGLLSAGLNLAEVERMMLVRLFWFFSRTIVDMEILTFHLLEYSGRIIRQGKGLYQLVWLF